MEHILNRQQYEILDRMRAMKSAGAVLTTSAVAEAMNLPLMSVAGTLTHLVRHGAIWRAAKGDPWSITADGTVVMAPAPTSKPKAAPGRYVSANRKCLCCGRTFRSEWAGHRMCKNCKGRSDAGLWA